MNILEFTLLILLCSFFAGFLGSLTGLGGGVVIAPLLGLAFGVSVRYAIGASLVSVIATSSGAAAAYVKEGFSFSASRRICEEFPASSPNHDLSAGAGSFSWDCCCSWPRLAPA